MYLRIIRFLLLSTFILACVDEQIIPGEVPELPSSSETNSRPTDFEINVLESSSNSAILDWGPVYDRDGDKLYNSIYINDSFIASQTNDFVFNVTELEPETEYTVRIVVTDSISESKEAQVSFTTKKHFIRYDNIYDNYDGNVPFGFAINKTNDGGYVIAGNILFNQNGYGLFVLKIDSLGYEQWHTIVEGHHDLTISGTIIQTKDNGFAIADQFAFTKLNSNGDLQWQRPGPSWDHYYNSAIETDDLGYLVVGMQGGSITRGSITKFDLNGALKWQKLFDGNAAITMSICSQIVRTSQNEYIIAGTHQNPTIDFELAVAKIDGLGNIDWIKNYEHEWQTFYMGVKMESSVDGFMIGSTSLTFSGVNYVRMTKVDVNGGLVWDRTFNWGGYETTCKDISAMEDGSSLFVGGYANSSHDETAYVAKIGPNGDLVWRKDFKPGYLDYVWQFRGIEQTADKGLALMGLKGYIWSGNGKDEGLWVMKTDEKGE